MKKLTKLKNARKSRDLSQSDLAKLLFMDQPAVSKWERGLRVPHPNTIRRIAQVLGCRPGDLV